MRVMKRLETKGRESADEKMFSKKCASDMREVRGKETDIGVDVYGSGCAAGCGNLDFEKFLESAGDCKGQFLTENLLDCSKSLAGSVLREYKFAFEAVRDIGKIVQGVIAKLNKSEFVEMNSDIFVHKSATVDPTAHLGHGLVVDAGAEIRHSAFIRGNCIVGKNSVVGNSVELKNAILFDEAKVPHFNYVGDSILGYRAHLGAGAIVSNFKADGNSINIVLNKKKFCTGLRKFGAIVGDYVEIGCNCVLNPGSIVGRDSNVYPTTSVRGVIESGVIVKSTNKIVKKGEGTHGKVFWH